MKKAGPATARIPAWVAAGVLDSFPPENAWFPVVVADRRPPVRAVVYEFDAHSHRLGDKVDLHHRVMRLGFVVRQNHVAQIRIQVSELPFSSDGVSPLCTQFSHE